MDIITMLKEDHIMVADMLEQLEKTTERASKTRVELLAKLEKELQVHMEFEETILYPAVKASASREGVELTNEAYAEHAAARDVLEKLKGLSTSDEMWKANLTVFKENIEHHVEEEEDMLFEHAERGIESEQLETMGEQYAAMKKRASGGDRPRGAQTAGPAR